MARFGARLGLSPAAVTWLGDPLTLLVLTVIAFFWLLIMAGAGLGWLLRRRHARDMEAVIDATREDIPNHVPTAWTKEYL